MRVIRTFPGFCCAMLLLVAGTPASAQEQAAAVAQRDERIPLFSFVHERVLRSVALSPDGRHIVAVSPPAVDAVPQIAIWNADDLSQPPVRFDLEARDGSRWKPVGAFWLNDNTVYAVGQQTLDAFAGARKILTFRGKPFVYNLEKKRLSEPFGGGSSDLLDSFTDINLFNRLPLDDNKVLVSAGNLEGATDLYEMELEGYRLKRVFRGASGSSPFIDMMGEVRGRTSFDGDGETARIKVEARRPGSTSWELIAEFFARDRQGIQPVGFGKDPNILFMTDNKDREYSVIREFNLTTKQLSEPVFAHARYDATGVVFAQTKKKYGELVGFTYDGPREGEVYWVDEDRARLHESLKAAFPGKFIDFASASDDERRVIVIVSASNDPGTYYLYDAAKGLTELARPYPSLSPEKLAETKLVSYKARDGLNIPAFLTLPKKGSKPFPLVVMPHGGPWARDDINFDFSMWRPFLADRGYAVLQPQYRGSQGWGQTLWRAGDREWGQKMQDDKDDGVRWLVEQGIVDPERVAMYGFSYGGYAAMAAIVRDNPPYQCAIAGAGLSELRTFDKITFEGRFGREFQNPTIAGLSPLDVVEKASIPILIFHGNRDQIVPIEQSEKYYAALKRAGKDVKYVQIDDYGHGPSLSITKQAQVLELLESYLANDCGPGGL